MSDIVKQESVKLLFTVFFLVVIIAVGWFVAPKIAQRMGKSQAEGYWKQEQEANDRRLFGGT